MRYTDYNCIGFAMSRCCDSRCASSARGFAQCQNDKKPLSHKSWKALPAPHQSGFVSGNGWGTKMLKTVPWCRLEVLLCTLTVPSCLWMISWLTHNPSPVPVMPLVEQKGSKMRFN